MKTNSMKILYECRLIFHKRTKQALAAMSSPVIISIFMKNHEYEDPLFFMDVGFHEPGLMT